MLKKIFITGPTGMVGSYIDSCSWHGEVVKVGRADVDIADTRSVETYFDKHHDDVDILLHLAAETDVDRCEQDVDHAMRVNTLGTQNIVNTAAKYGFPLLYVSTVGIFGGDGSPGPFHEFFPPSPANAYGFSKLYGEQIVRSHLQNFFIVRAGWMMGGVEKDKKFVMKIIRQILEGKKDLYALEEVVGSPTYAKELLTTISQLIRTTWWGTYHCTNNGKMSRYEIAQAIAEYIDPSIRVIPVKSDHFKLPAPRAPSEYAENKMLTLRGLNNMSSVEDALQMYLDEIAASGLIHRHQVVIPAGAGIQTQP